ncbi:hypothetical protein IB024_09860 [Brucella sp. 6810]|uniref:Uncharacterized protein n=1 Tax=Brucella inopinata TaxID=1218315 RepID=A0AAW7B4C3_9HYPH|nr:MULTISPECIES: hypothetical protein [Brucella]KEY05860.1 hypothetical protein IL59_0201075 [Brucella suis bv. 4 str. 40]CUW43994.1 hypothetical protein BF3285c1_1316 [Brucella vulpis]APX69454.1 hypothetical protein BKD03_08675 [Brucella sp. 09RB8471]EFM56474.1 Hypothetical protein BIBO1_1738 [Brucella inopinata BO1]EFM59050.1 Hypothetical protein BIBO2_2067 [Brucella sp. BO2]
MYQDKESGFNKVTLFKPNLSRMEAKSAVTDKTAKAILDTERAAVEAKTERLRAARLASEENKPKAASKRK